MTTNTIGYEYVMNHRDAFNFITAIAFILVFGTVFIIYLYCKRVTNKKDLNIKENNKVYL